MQFCVLSFLTITVLFHALYIKNGLEMNHMYDTISYMTPIQRHHDKLLVNLIATYCTR